MKTGRELDALIAEKVMGLSLAHMPDARDSKSGVIVSEISDSDVYFWDGRERDWSPIPNYSTDVAAAWEVVEKFKSKKIEFALIRDVSIWQASFQWNDSFPYHWDCIEWVDGETAPHAICLAALKAVGVKKYDK